MGEHKISNSAQKQSQFFHRNGMANKDEIITLEHFQWAQFFESNTHVNGFQEIEFHHFLE